MSLLKCPKKSHRKSINIPAESVELAELLGIIFGDGGINNSWQVRVFLNSIADFPYSDYIISLVNSLCNLKTHRRIRPFENTLVLTWSSAAFQEFLINKGALYGNKVRQQIDKPTWILKRYPFQKAFVRGLVDTDGCIYTHTHKVGEKTYTNIGICITSYSLPLLKSVYKILQTSGISAHYNTKRTSLYLYSHKAVLEYLRVFGSSNPRIYEKYNNWRGVRVVD